LIARAEEKGWAEIARLLRVKRAVQRFGYAEEPLPKALRFSVDHLAPLTRASQAAQKLRDVPAAVAAESARLAGSVLGSEPDAIALIVALDLCTAANAGELDECGALRLRARSLGLQTRNVYLVLVGAETEFTTILPSDLTNWKFDDFGPALMRQSQIVMEILPDRESGPVSERDIIDREIAIEIAPALHERNAFSSVSRCQSPQGLRGRCKDLAELIARDTTKWRWMQWAKRALTMIESTPASRAERLMDQAHTQTETLVGNDLGRFVAVRDANTSYYRALATKGQILADREQARRQLRLAEELRAYYEPKVKGLNRRALFEYVR
jgi:hypothetical protein